MALPWKECFPDIAEEKLIEGITHFEHTVHYLGRQPWRHEGTLLCTGTGRSRIGYAIRKTSCSWHFRNRDAVALYREQCGACRTSAVTIQYGYADLPEYRMIAHVLAMVLHGAELA